jgi:hypothetical protein
MWKKVVFMGFLGLIFAGGIGTAYWYVFGPGRVGTEANPAFQGVLTPRLKADVETEIRARVSELSPEKEVLGGKFYITKIEFLSNSRAIVEYEDGHNAFKANVDFYVDPSGIVRIVDWQITQKN